MVNAFLTLAVCTVIAQSGTADSLEASGHVTVLAPVKKEIFSVRHPKIYRSWRKTRRVCQSVLPVVQFAGSAAQIVMMFH